MKRLLSAVLITMITAAPAWSQKKLEQIAARVNSEIILKSDIDRHLENLRAELAERVERKEFTAADALKIFEEDKPNVLRDLIDRSLLVQVAKDAGLNADLDVFKTMEQLRTERNFA